VDKVLSKRRTRYRIGQIFVEKKNTLQNWTKFCRKEEHVTELDKFLSKRRTRYRIGHSFVEEEEYVNDRCPAYRQDIISSVPIYVGVHRLFSRGGVQEHSLFFGAIKAKIISLKKV
jgi:hypothetical protein